jgi:23S rRNA pseudouridine2605 synthase
LLSGADRQVVFASLGSEGFSLTAEQLEASRAERMRLNGTGTFTYEDARTWIEETGLCLFLPRKQFSTFVAPSFVEAVGGERNPAPAARTVAQAEELLVRLESAGVALRLNLQGQAGEQPDFVVAAWVLPYVYALRGDRDWRRIPQLTGSRAVSPLAVQAYRHLETGDATISQLKQALGREVTESAVLRAVTELWQQLRIVPVLSAPGKAPQWQLLRVRYQKAIAEGASTSQVTAISVLASIYLQAVIAATMEEVELFLAPLTARSKVREVLRGLVATRQVHTISMGHAQHFYVAGTLPEFSTPATLLGGLYSSSAMPASSAFLRSFEPGREAAAPESPAAAPSVAPAKADKMESQVSDEAIEQPRLTAPHFSRKPTRVRDRKPASSASRNRGSRPTPRNSSAARRGSQVRWARDAAENGRTKQSGSHADGNDLRKGKPAAPLSLRNGHGNAGKPAAKASARPVSRRAADARSRRKPALTASAKTGSRSRYGFRASSGQQPKKRG